MKSGTAVMEIAVVKLTVIKVVKSAVMKTVRSAEPICEEDRAEEWRPPPISPIVRIGI